MNENEIMMNEEVMDNNEVIEDTVVYPEEEVQESGLGGVLVKAAVAGAGVVGAIAWLNRDKIKAKIEARRIERMKKDGYIVYKPSNDDNTEASNVVDVEFDDSDETEE